MNAWLLPVPHCTLFIECIVLFFISLHSWMLLTSILDIILRNMAIPNPMWNFDMAILSTSLMLASRTVHKT